MQGMLVEVSEWDTEEYIEREMSVAQECSVSLAPVGSMVRSPV